MATEDGIAASYMLRATLVGHSQDVRVVATSCFPEGAIVSGSRDRTTRIWTQSEYVFNGCSQLHPMYFFLYLGTF